MAELPLDLEGMEAFLRSLTPAQFKATLDAVPESFKRWAPQPGPQSDAWFSEADELLYGGAAGGGKSDLLLGLAISQHQSSVIFRAQSVDLQALWERLQKIVPNPAKQNATTKHMKVREGCSLEMSHLSEPGSERAHMGRARDFMGFDEAAQLDELRVNFVINWIRSTDPKQRKRAVFATNPPMPEIRDGRMTDTAQGDWLLRWFAPWIDDTFPNPAKIGELRWCFMREAGDRLETIWVAGPGRYRREDGKAWPNATEEDVEKGLAVTARSRTFIKSLVKDNTFLRGTGYAEKLSGTPEPMRSMLLNGDFTVKGADHPMQVIPTQWVLAAQERWKARPWEEVRNLRMLVLAGDIAQGGMDTTVLAPLYETDFFEELITQPGSKTPTGVEVLQMIVAERTDKAVIALDGQGGWAGSTRDLLLRDQDIDAEMFISSACDQTWTPNMLYAYYNLRAKMWWEFRLALDPKSGFEICLPPSPRLRTQLTTPQFEVRGKKLIVESKDDIRKRLGGGSTDEADAVLMAWQYRAEGLLLVPDLTYDIVERLNGRVPDPRKGGEALPIDDPRGGW